MIWFLYSGFWLSALLFIASYAGAVHPALDSLTVLRVPLAVVVIAGLVLTDLRVNLGYWAAVLASSGFLIWHIGAWDKGLPKAGSYVLYHHNLLYANKRPELVLQEIETHDPDMITFVEVSNTNRFLLEELSERYPHVAACEHPLYGAAVLTRLPLGPEEEICVIKENGFAAAALSVIGPDGPSWVIAAHLHWPWPFGQHESLKDTVAMLEAASGPKIIAGDFNAMPWSHAVKETARVGKARYIGPHRRTFRRYRVPLPLDHVLAGSGEVTVLDRLGSDHHALLATVDFTAPK